MLVRDVMQPKPITVSPETTLPDAVRLMSQRGIRHLPVVGARGLVGIVSDRDLKRVMASPATTLTAHELGYLLDRLSMREVMSTAVVTTGPMMPVEEAARLMVQDKIGALPVTEGGELVGIVTETDVLALFVRAMGVGEPSSRLDVPLDDAPGALAEVTRALADAGLTVASIVTLRAPDGRRQAIVRVRTIDPRPAVRALAAAGYPVRDGARLTEGSPA
jgi:acetoin utilization protein AcuB